MNALFERFTLSMTKDQAASASHQGQCDADVKALLLNPKIKQQLKKLSPEIIRAELKEYGAWNAVELSDEQANQERIVWLAAGNITEGRK